MIMSYHDHCNACFLSGSKKGDVRVGEEELLYRGKGRIMSDSVNHARVGVGDCNKDGGLYGGGRGRIYIPCFVLG